MWFGASRAGCEYLVERLRDPEFVARFRHYFCAGEMLFNTAVAMSNLPSGQGNHAISQYIGARPQWIGLDDLDDLASTGKYFARKFPDQPEAPVRLQMLSRLGVGRGKALPGPHDEGAVPVADPIAEPGDAVPAGALSVPSEEDAAASLVMRDGATPVIAAQSAVLPADARLALGQPNGNATHSVSLL